MTPLSELDAVNKMLGIGLESPVSSLEADELVDASIALSMLRQVSVEVQGRGWWFNTEADVPLTPDQSGHILLPDNVLRIDSTGASSGTDVIQRGVYLYDRTDRTKVFQAPVTVSWTLALPFDELPSSAREYISVRAARMYQDRHLGSDSLHAYTKQDEMTASARLLEEDIDAEDSNFLSGQFITNLQARS